MLTERPVTVGTDTRPRLREAYAIVLYQDEPAPAGAVEEKGSGWDSAWPPTGRPPVVYRPGQGKTE